MTSTHSLEDVLVDSSARIAKALSALGTADASTPMGRLEAHGAVLRDTGTAIAHGLEAIAAALYDVAAAIDHLTRKE